MAAPPAPPHAPSSGSSQLSLAGRHGDVEEDGESVCSTARLGDVAACSAERDTSTFVTEMRCTPNDFESWIRAAESLLCVSSSLAAALAAASLAICTRAAATTLPAEIVSVTSEGATPAKRLASFALKPLCAVASKSDTWPWNLNVASSAWGDGAA